MIALAVLGWLWALPMTLIGGVVFLCVFGIRGARVRWRGNHGTVLVIEVEVAWLPYDAVTMGSIQAYRSGVLRTDRLRRHEDTHTFQGYLFGILNLVAYGVGSLVSKIGGTGWYTGNFLEAWARSWSK